MSLKFKSLEDLGKGSWKVNRDDFSKSPIQESSSKKPKGGRQKSTSIDKTLLNEKGPQAKLAALIKDRFPGFDIEEDKSDAIPKRRFQIDIAFNEHKLAVEVDGWQYHGKFKSGFQRDRVKQNLLVVEGWRLLRFTYKQIMNDPDGCISMIERCLSQCARK